jgi:tRNA A-37 threonylcarbamoyl transferase component Bud32
MGEQPPLAIGDTVRVEVSTAPTLAEASAATPPPSPPRAAPGGAIDPRYQIGEVLGRGGMGEVSLARDERVGRDVALKRLRVRDRGASSESIERFLREARVQGRLEHPAIVPVHDLGVDGDGVPYFAMKRLAGLTLAEILARHASGDPDAVARFPRRALLARFAEVCLAVEFAHTRGVIHRDLKPSNVMLGDFGEVYVLDWGIAKVGAEEVAAAAPTLIARGDLATLDSKETAAGTVLGTPGYMAPEQLRGEAIDHRADVYALGAVLFEILTGLPLHASAAAIPSTLDGAEARASVRCPDSLVPPELEDVCVRATARDPADRFASVREVHDAVVRYLDGDRDQQRRRALDDGHAEAAQRVLAGGRGTAARSEAMREAGQALALDPTHPAARAIVGRLMLEPPAETQPEVVARIERELVVTASTQARTAVLSYTSFLLFAAFLLWLGIESWAYFAVFVGVALGNIAMAMFAARDARLSRASIGAAMLGNAALVTMVGLAFGPFLLVPALATATTMSFVAHPAVRRPGFAVAVGALPIVLLLALEGLGAVPPTMSFHDGELILRSWAVALPPDRTLVTLTVASLAMIVNAGFFALMMRRRQLAAERQLQLHAWHLQQVVPIAPSGR